MVAAAAAVTGAVVWLYLRLDPGFFVVNDARDASLPQGFEMARLVADGQLPSFTTRAMSGGNQHVGFGSGSLHPLNLLVWSLWPVLDSARRVGLVMVAALGLTMYAGGYLMVRVTGRSARLYAHLAGTLMVTAPMFLVFTLPGWWNNALGVASFAWAVAALLLLLRRATWVSVLFVGAATWGVFTSGWPHSFLAFGIVCVVVAAPLLFEHGRPLGGRIRSVVALALPVVAGVAMAAPAFSEFLAVGDEIARGGSVDNADNALVPSLNVLASVANPVAGDFLSAWGYRYLPIPFGFATLLVLVAVFFTEHTRERWRTDGVLQALTGSAIVFYLATQLPANLGPFRWPIRFLSFAVVCLVAATAYYLATTPRAWTRHRFGAAALVVVLGAAYAAARIPDPSMARRGALYLPLVLVLGVVCVFALYRISRIRRTLEVGLVVGGVLAVWAMPPVGWWNPGLGFADRAAQEALAQEARGGFLLDVNPHRDGWAPGLSSSRYLMAGISVVNGYDPVRHAGLAALVRASDQGYLGPGTLDRLTDAPPHWPGQCWTDLLRVSAVITEADPGSGRHALLEGCGFDLVSVEGNAALFTVDRGFADPRSTLAVADAAIETSADELVSERVERVTVSNPTGRPGRVAFARLAWPGYEARLDGQPLAVTSVDGVTVEVEVPADARGVLTLTYEPVSFRAAWTLSAVGALGLAVLAVMIPRRKDRRP